MRVWLGILVLAVVVTAGISVYLVEHPPQAAAEPAPAEPAPADEGRAPLDGLMPPGGATPPAAPPSGLEPGIVPDPDNGPLVPPRDAPFHEDDAGGNAPPGPGDDGLPDPPAGDEGQDPPPEEGGEGEGAGDGNGQDEGGDDPPAPPAPPPSPRSWTWTHDYRTESASPTAFHVPAGISQLEFKVVFATPSGALPPLAAVSATLVGPDSVARVPCASSGLVVGQLACGPFRTDASPGRWEVQYGGTGGVTATLTLSELS